MRGRHANDRQPRPDAAPVHQVCGGSMVVPGFPSRLLISSRYLQPTDILGFVPRTYTSTVAREIPGSSPIRASLTAETARHRTFIDRGRLDRATCINRTVRAVARSRRAMTKVGRGVKSMKRLK